jgi:polyisoprenoid-binding protein YceI
MSNSVVQATANAVRPASGTWNFDPSHSHLEFSVRHMVVGKTRGRFGSFSGTVNVADEPSASSVAVEIDATSVDTRDPKRDEHLRSADFLDVERHPALTFTSTAIRGSGTEWTVTGDLTIHGVTRSVDVDVVLEGVVEQDPFGFARAAFSGEAEIDREDYGLTWNAALEGGGVLVGKKIKISFEIEAVRSV